MQNLDSKESLTEALAGVEKSASRIEASRRYKILRRYLIFFEKIYLVSIWEIQVLSSKDEEVISNALSQPIDWTFSLTPRDVALLAK